MKIKKCPVCLSYTLEETCNNCSSKTINPHPARYSPQDRYGKYRRMMKLSESAG